MSFIPLVQSSNPEILALWCSICREMHQKEQAWLRRLRLYGVKAAHPNDAWVKREEQSFQLCYPQFNDGVQVGDLVVLGCASREEEALWVRVTKIEVGFFGVTHYHYVVEMVG